MASTNQTTHQQTKQSSNQSPKIISQPKLINWTHLVNINQNPVHTNQSLNLYINQTYSQTTNQPTRQSILTE